MDAAGWVCENWSQIKQSFPAAGTPILGVCGSQGSGKSWLAKAIVQRLGLHAAVLSLDDFYLPKQHRRALASQVHPNLKTRGVPGTHDMALLAKTLDALKTGPAQWPKFDKIADDRLPTSEVNSLAQAPDLIVLEGWCVGAPPQGDADLRDCVNAFESASDAGGAWRHFVNDQLSSRLYRAVFDQIDCLLFLRAPDFACVYDWRLEQEHTTYAKVGRPVPKGAGDDIKAFIHPFERLTRHMLHTPFADITLQLTPGRQVADASYR